MRTTTMALAAGVCLATLFALPSGAEPPSVLYLCDSPVESPNLLWDDQWSGGTVHPSGEVLTPAPPTLVGQWGATPLYSMARVASWDEPHRAYSDVPYTGRVPGGPATAFLTLRQTCAEPEEIGVALYRASADGCGDCEMLTLGFATADCGEWPPSVCVVDLGWLSPTDLENQRLMLEIFSTSPSRAGEGTDIVWAAPEWPSWIELPQGGSHVEEKTWSEIKTLYR